MLNVRCDNNWPSLSSFYKSESSKVFSDENDLQQIFSCGTGKTAIMICLRASTMVVWYVVQCALIVIHAFHLFVFLFNASSVYTVTVVRTTYESAV